ncbi:hypothetical protein V6N11_053755 [Hibiscus sabdariffa]|uniref:RNase H type-1 domain-containing protein n=1 Tax=Hibiscus sabdariffa TaxID=183260 RepID=A0ABR2S225_9ROSI
MAELWVVHNSLVYAWEFGFTCVQLETDNKVVANILLNQFDALEGCSLVAIIVELLTRNWTIHVRHICLENNMVVDRAGALCRGGPMGIIEMTQVSRLLFDLVQKEANEG